MRLDSLVRGKALRQRRERGGYNGYLLDCQTRPRRLTLANLIVC
jgi:hypothetical protein